MKSGSLPWMRPVAAQVVSGEASSSGKRSEPLTALGLGRARRPVVSTACVQRIICLW